MTTRRPSSRYRYKIAVLVVNRALKKSLIFQSKLAQPQDAKPTVESVEAAKAELTATAERIQEKCKRVQSKLDEIALNDEELKTKEALMLAANKEKEAMEAEVNAKKREEEAKVRALFYGDTYARTLGNIVTYICLRISSDYAPKSDGHATPALGAQEQA